MLLAGKLYDKYHKNNLMGSLFLQFRFESFQTNACLERYTKTVIMMPR